MFNHSFVPANNWLDHNSEESTGVSAGFLLAVTLLAAGLRFYHLAAPSLWVDEILTWNMIKPGADLHFWPQIWDAIQAPLYLLFVWPLVRIQENEWMLRLPAAVIGVVTVPIFGLFLSRFLDRRATRLGTLLLAISPFHIWYSQEGRGYSFLIFFVVLLGLAFWSMLDKGPDLKRALAFALAGTGAVLSNMSAVFLLAGMGLTVLLFERPRKPRHWWLWVVALGTVVLFSGPWILKASGIWAIDRILPGVDTGLSLRGQTTFSPLAIPYSLFTFFFGHSFGPSLRELHQPDRLAVLKTYLPQLVLGAIPVGMGLLWSLRYLGKKRIFLLVLVFVPVLLLALLAIRNIKPWNPRYVAVVFPFLLGLVALGLTRLPGHWARVSGILMVILSFWSLGGYYFSPRYVKADIRSAVTIVNEKNTQQEPVLVPVVTGVYSFYDQGDAVLIDSFNLPPMTKANEAQTFFDEKLQPFQGFWFVSSREWFFDPQGFLPIVLTRAGQLSIVKELPGVKVYHWEKHRAVGLDHE